VHETATGLHGQNALFRPLVNCNHPLECTVAKLPTREHRVELQHININTIRYLSRLDTVSVDRLPIIKRKIHATAVTEYKYTNKRRPLSQINLQYDFCEELDIRVNITQLTVDEPRVDSQQLQHNLYPAHCVSGI